MTMRGSWKTTTVGWLTLISAICSAAIAILDGDPATTPNVAELMGVLVGLGLMAARDNNVASEQARAGRDSQSSILPLFAMGLIVTALVGCSGVSTIDVSAKGAKTAAQPASVALMDNDGHQVGSYLGVAPTNIKQDADGAYWTTTPGVGGILTFPTEHGNVSIWSPKDAKLISVEFTPEPKAGSPALKVGSMEFNVSTVAAVYAQQFRDAMDAIKDMTRAEAEVWIKRAEVAGQITTDVADVIRAAVIPLLP